MATTISSREFNQDTGRAKRAAAEGPVYITDRGRPAHVLLTYAEYVRLAGQDASIVELLTRTDGVGDIQFDPPRIMGTATAADLSE